MLDEFMGLPAHPLIIHLPVVFVPLAFLGILAAIVRPVWRTWLLPLCAGAAGLALVGVQLAVISGGNLREVVGDSELIKEHEDLALQARPLVALFFVAVAAAFYVNWRGVKAAMVLPLLIVAMLTGGLASTWVARTGDAGGQAVWEGEIGYSDRKAKAKAEADGDAGAGTTSTTAAKGAEATGDQAIDIAGFAFGPKDVTLKVGTKVTWTNSDSARHNAQSRGEAPVEFKTKDLSKGDTDTITFDKAGEYGYVCSFHTYMTGRIMVSS